MLLPFCLLDWKFTPDCRLQTKSEWQFWKIICGTDASWHQETHPGTLENWDCVCVLNRYCYIYVVFVFVYNVSFRFVLSFHCFLFVLYFRFNSLYITISLSSFPLSSLFFLSSFAPSFSLSVGGWIYIVSFSLSQL